MRYSLHKVNKEDSQSFSPSDYSKFKYGDKLTAKQFGTDLPVICLLFLIQIYILNYIKSENKNYFWVVFSKRFCSLFAWPLRYNVII